MFFLDFFDDFLGVSETEPDGESLGVEDVEAPSLLKHEVSNNNAYFILS